MRRIVHAAPHAWRLKLFGESPQVLLPPPPLGSRGPRAAAHVSLCQEKPHFLLLADNLGLVVVYKRKTDSPSGQTAGQSVPTDTEGVPQGPSNQAGGAVGVPTDTASPFVQLQLNLQEHGPLLDVFWLPALPQQQQQDSGGGAAEDTKVAGGRFFVTVQRHHVAVWSVPLLRILAVTLRKNPQSEPVKVRCTCTCICTDPCPTCVTASLHMPVILGVRGRTSATALLA